MRVAWFPGLLVAIRTQLPVDQVPFLVPICTFAPLQVSLGGTTVERLRVSLLQKV